VRQFLEQNTDIAVEIEARLRELLLPSKIRARQEEALEAEA
jgi:hypothetical protein